MKVHDAVAGLVALAVAAATIGLARTFPVPAMLRAGPGSFPQLIGLVLGACAIALLYRGRRQRHISTAIVLGDWATSPRHALNTLLVPGGVVFYLVTAEFLGFLIAAAVVLTAQMAALGRSLRSSAAVALGVTLLIHTVFAKLLLVPLPWGLLRAFAW